MSASECGSICSWSIDSGRKLSSIQIEPQMKEVLAFAVDENAEFAVTGHINGVGYVSIERTIVKRNNKKE